MSRSDIEVSPYGLIADFDGDTEQLFNVEFDEELPILPLRNMILFPGTVLPVNIARDFSLAVVKKANAQNSYIGVVAQTDETVDNPLGTDLAPVGTVARVIRVIELPGQNGVTAFLQGYCRFALEGLLEVTPYYVARATRLYEQFGDMSNYMFHALVESVRDATGQLLKLGGGEEHQLALKTIKNTTLFLNFVCNNLPFPIATKIRMLEQDDEAKRAALLFKALNIELEYASIKAEIRSRAHSTLDKQQHDYFLQQQIREIQDELGESPVDQDIRELTEELNKKNVSDAVYSVVEREIGKLDRISPQTPDYNVQLNYLQTLVALPWQNYAPTNTNLRHAAAVLDKDHYGLEKIKERILEHIAVATRRTDGKAPILCLYGPPGVGKTSLGKSIARALGREYVRVSLGGVHDEAEIRGHRRTYIGAMPGRIIKSLMKCKTSNPVFVLDELDKVSSATHNGDPQSALLEVLDPEQNEAFHDNYLDVPYDLSKIFFIATANSLSTIPQPLLDRMEVVEMTGYISQEKEGIARRHLIPKQQLEAGLTPEEKIKLPVASVRFLIDNYTRESGVRQLEKQIFALFRKVVYRSMRDGTPLPRTIEVADISELLGKPPYHRDVYQHGRHIGVVTGLAWTSVGGEILYIETSLSRGKGAKLTLTGNLGDVMKESATLALEYVKAHADRLGISDETFENWNIHIHVPEGAVPKDGPSAGITIATSIASALTHRPVRDAIAMTGEITLRGKVLPVGGIKEKILAAKRAGINTILLSEDNRKDIADIPEMYLKGLTFRYVENVWDVLDFALLQQEEPAV